MDGYEMPVRNEQLLEVATNGTTEKMSNLYNSYS